MPFQTKLRIMIDISMIIALLLLMPYSLLGEAAHEWIGLAMFVLFILHHKLNIGWIKNLRKGKIYCIPVPQDDHGPADPPCHAMFHGKWDRDLGPCIFLFAF